MSKGLHWQALSTFVEWCHGRVGNEIKEFEVKQLGNGEGKFKNRNKLTITDFYWQFSKRDWLLLDLILFVGCESESSAMDRIKIECKKWQ